MAETKRNYLDVGQWHKSTSGKSWFLRLGSGFLTEDGAKIYLDALPVPVDGKIELDLKPRLSRLWPT